MDTYDKMEEDDQQDIDIDSYGKDILSNKCDNDRDYHDRRNYKLATYKALTYREKGYI